MSSATELGSIITFYSYKGGTGRSMALANVACLLAQQQRTGRGVLMVDWDLEAPGLHRYFRDRFTRQFGSIERSEEVIDRWPGLIDLFVEFDVLTTKLADEGSAQSEQATRALVDSVDLDRFVLHTDVHSLYLLKAGRFDDRYSTYVNTFNWESLYNTAPWLISSFAQRLAEKFRYILVDSRTGLTDISGICSILLPEKLVLVFTPNRQSLAGVLDLVARATQYRRQSADLRPLVVYPLPSRIEALEPGLRRDWRFGSSRQGIEGYQPRFEQILQEVYALPQLDLTGYFEEVQIQQVPRYAYGEEIAVLGEPTQDRFSLSRSYENFAERLVNLSGPWETLHPESAAPSLSAATVRAEAAEEEAERLRRELEATQQVQAAALLEEQNRRRVWIGVGMGVLIFIIVLAAILILKR